MLYIIGRKRVLLGLLFLKNGYIKNEEAIAGGWLLIFIGAFENATKELAYNQNFYDLISNKGSSSKALTCGPNGAIQLVSKASNISSLDAELI